jgi:L,D-transpeptidase YcbB
LVFKLQNALRKFQARNGLPQTGELDLETRVLLNRPIQYFIKQISLNLERWRWLPQDLGAKYVLVNIPAFALLVRNQGQTVQEMRIVAGQVYRKTPCLSHRITSVILNPVWEIPPNILLQDKLYALKNDPEFFQKNHIFVYGGWGENARPIDPETINWKQIDGRKFYSYYRFLQGAGPQNPLGQVKIMFPNPYNIYLHDTPKKKLFAADRRDFSSGCIRLENARELAGFILPYGGQPFWTQERLANALEGGLEQKINLTRRINVHIIYLTAWVSDAQPSSENPGITPDQVLNFFPDIYNMDQKLNENLE